MSRHVLAISVALLLPGTVRAATLDVCGDEGRSETWTGVPSPSREIVDLLEGCYATLADAVAAETPATQGAPR